MNLDTADRKRVCLQGESQCATVLKGEARGRAVPVFLPTVAVQTLRALTPSILIASSSRRANREPRHLKNLSALTLLRKMTLCTRG